MTTPTIGQATARECFGVWGGLGEQERQAIRQGIGNISRR